MAFLWRADGDPTLYAVWELVFNSLCVQSVNALEEKLSMFVYAMSTRLSCSDISPKRTDISVVHRDGEEIAGCFTLIVFLVPCVL